VVQALPDEHPAIGRSHDECNFIKSGSMKPSWGWQGRSALWRHFLSCGSTRAGA